MASRQNKTKGEKNPQTKTKSGESKTMRTVVKESKENSRGSTANRPMKTQGEKVNV
jgi:hypothetical protein